MNTPLLVLDCHYLCHRAFHAQGGLSWKGRATGVIYGFLNSITSLKDQFQTDTIAFCFEHPHLNRRDLFPDYKCRRVQQRSPAEKAAHRDLVVQINQLRDLYLPRIGFKNIFSFCGMESDDIMAQFAFSASPDQEVVLVTSDADLWQCLRPHVTIYSPQKQKYYTEGWFKKEYRIRPKQWAIVKALAGCKGDGVPGIRGIGEATALKYLRDEMTGCKALRLIQSAEGKEVVRRNRQLVELPFKDCPIPEMQSDEINVAGWEWVCHQLGMKSLVQKPPLYIRTNTRYA